MAAAKRLIDGRLCDLQRRHHQVRRAISPRVFSLATACPVAWHCARPSANAGWALGPGFLIIGDGGPMSGGDAHAKREPGAGLVHIAPGSSARGRNRCAKRRSRCAAPDGRGLQVRLSIDVSIGSERMRLPVSAKIAFVTAGAIGGVPGSPMPPGFSALGTMWTSTFGISFMRSTW